VPMSPNTRPIDLTISDIILFRFSKFSIISLPPEFY
jgi:hypothetical protein